VAALDGATVSVNRLCVRGDVPDVLRARLRTERVLDAVCLHPRGIRPAAILCVRRLGDPRPRSVVLDGWQTPPRCWVAEIEVAIDRLARGAARPAHGAVPSGTEAVLFADRAEMLACLAADWSSGQAGGRWWWRALIGDVCSLRFVVKTWLETPEYVAAGLEELARQGRATSFVARLGVDEARRMTTAVVTAHGLAPPGLTPSPDRSSGADLELEASTPALPSRGRLAPSRASRADVIAAPWAGLVPEADHPALHLEQRRLLAVALLLRRAVSGRRTAALVHAALAWAPVAADRAESTDAIADGRRNVEPDPPAAVVRTATATRERSSRRPRVIDQQSTGGKGDRETRALAPGDIVPVSRPREVPAAEPCTIEAGPERCRADGPRHSKAVEARTAATTETTQTELGGLLYLVNLGIFLGLYGDFTTPRSVGLDVPIWDFVELVGRPLVPRRHRPDPIWPMLGRLSLRAGGARRRASRDRQLDASMPSIRERLRLALGVRRDRHAGRLLIERSARVVLSPTHVDVFFLLSQLSIAVRLSGLDRNPGWIPAAGRIVSFHYD
jgi:hypothetical protein